MFLTVTPNPSFDKTLHVKALRRGRFQRATDVSLEAGGKGINVARALALAGHEVVAVIPAELSGANEFSAVLGNIDGLELVATDSGSPIRTNITIIEPDGTTTKVNESGSELDEEATALLLEETVAFSGKSDWVVVSGSHPPGFDPQFIANLRAALPETASLAVDANGSALGHAVDAGVDLIKPNREELEMFIGSPLHTIGDVVDAAQSLRERGVGSVLVSLGADGAVLIEEDVAISGRAVNPNVANTVGTGDAFLAGFLSAGAKGHPGLGEALAWGHAAAGSPTTAFAQATDDNRTAVELSHQLDPTVRLVESSWGVNG